MNDALNIYIIGKINVICDCLNLVIWKFCYIFAGAQKRIALNNTRKYMKYAIVLVLAFMVNTSLLYAQSGGGKSSYSRFGVGLLTDQSQTWNKSMGGVGIALPSGSKLNTMNPASYAYVDSLSIIFDVAMSGNFGQMSMGKNKVAVNNASFDYLVAGFRLHKNLGLAFGFRPYSSVDYNYYSSSNEVFRDENTGELVRSWTNYLGTGGLHQCFIGLGWKPFGNLSIGANASVMWGGYDHVVMQEFTQDGTSTADFNGFNFLQHADVLTYKLDLGAQYVFRMTSQDWLTLGATVGIGHHFDGDAYLYRYMSTGDTLKVDNEGGFDIPMTYAGGVAWQHKNNLLVSADAHYQTWADCKVPAMVVTDGVVSYPSTDKMYKNNYLLKAGLEYTPNPLATRGYFNRVKYRFGVSYSSPYMMIPQGESASMRTTEGPSELGLSLGFGFPISNRINARSMVNLGVQWLRRSPSLQNLITENYFIINVGVTFNERWFMKFKIQ